MHNSQIEKRGTIFCPTTVFALQPFLLQGSKLSTELTESTCRLPKSGSNRIQNSCVNWPTKWWFERGGSFHLHRPCVAFSFTTFWMSLEVQSLNKAIWQFYISETFCCLCTTIFCAQTTIQPAARIDRLSIFVNYSAVCALQSFVHKPRFNQLHDLTGWVYFGKYSAVCAPQFFVHKPQFNQLHTLLQQTLSFPCSRRKSQAAFFVCVCVFAATCCPDTEHLCHKFSYDVLREIQ